MRMNEYRFVIIILFSPLIIFAQEHNIFLDDSLFYTKYHSRYIFKDSLDDGTWILHNLYRKDSVKMGEETIILTGNYKNNKKEGTFNYYAYSIPLNKKKVKDKKYYVEISETYKSGLLNGIVIEKAYENITIRETMYENGKKNGLDICYYIPVECYGKLCQINYYSHDTLICKNFYRRNGKLLYTIMLFENGEYMQIEYDTIGRQKYVLSYDTNYVLYKWQKYYPNQILEIEMEGYFLQSIRKTIFDTLFYISDCFCNTDSVRSDDISLIRGVIKKYNQIGKLVTESKVEKEIENKNLNPFEESDP